MNPTHVLLLLTLFHFLTTLDKKDVEVIALEKLINEISKNDCFFDDSYIKINDSASIIKQDRINLSGCIKDSELHWLSNYENFDIYIVIDSFEKSSQINIIDSTLNQCAIKDTIQISVYRKALTHKNESFVKIDCFKDQKNYEYIYSYYFFFSKEGVLYDWCFIPSIKSKRK
jgi:hypothetical protein